MGQLVLRALLPLLCRWCAAPRTTASPRPLAVLLDDWRVLRVETRNMSPRTGLRQVTYVLSGPDGWSGEATGQRLYSQGGFRWAVTIRQGTASRDEINAGTLAAAWESVAK
jgi:hypothetical protein